MDTLRARKAELDGYISSNESLARELSENSAAQEETAAAIKKTSADIVTMKKAIAQSKKAVKKLPEEERPAAEQKVTAQSDEIAALLSTNAALKVKSKELSTKAKKIRVSIKAAQKTMPAVLDGSRRLKPELAAVQDGVNNWKILKARVSDKTRGLSEAESLVSKAEEELQRRTEAVEQAQSMLDAEYEPLLEMAADYLEKLMQPAFSEVLIGVATPNGMNHESTYVLALRDETRLQRIVEAVTKIRDSRRAAWDALPPDVQESYPTWPKHMDWMDDYLRVVGELDKATTRSKALEGALSAERDRMLGALAEGATESRP